MSQPGIPWSKRDTAGYLLTYSVKWTQLIGRRPLSPCRVGKTAGYTLLYFSSELYPDFPKCTLIWREVGPFHRLFSPHESLCAPSKGHQNPNLPALNKQWQPALLVWAGGPLLPKNTKTSTLPLKHTTPLFYTVERTVARESDQRKNTCQRLFANQTLSFYFAVLSCISFIMQAEHARRHRHVRAQHTCLRKRRL